MKPQKRLNAFICMCLFFFIVQGEARSQTQDLEEGKIETRFDREKNVTRIELHSMKVVSAPSEKLYFYLSGEYFGQSLEQPLQAISIGVVALSMNGFRFPDVCALTIVAGDKRLRMIPMLRYKQRLDPEYMETMVSGIGLDELERISDADTVEMRLYDRDLALNAAQMQRIREFTQLLYPAGFKRPKAETKTTREQGERGSTLGLGRFAIIAETDESARLTREIEQLMLKGRYNEALGLAERDARMLEQAHGQTAELAGALNNQAVLQKTLGDPIGAERSYRRALEILENVLGPEHPQIGILLDNLSLLTCENGDIETGQQLSERALSIFVHTLGWKNLHVGMTANNLAEIYSLKLDFKNAEALFLTALEIIEELRGKEDPIVGKVLDNLGKLYGHHGFVQAGLPLIERALKIFEKAYGSEHPDVATALTNLARQFIAVGEPSRADPLLRRAVAIFEKFFGTSHPKVADALHDLAMMYADGGQIGEALTAEARVQDIREHYLWLMLTAGSEQQKQLYANTLRSETNEAISLQLQLAPENRQALYLTLTTILRRKGRVLDAMAEQYRMLYSSGDPQDRELRGKLEEARSRLTSLIYHPDYKSTPEQYRSAVTLLESEIEKLQGDASTRSTKTRVQTTGLTLEQVQQAIPSDAALIEFVSYRPRFPLVAKPPSEPREVRHYAAYVLQHEGVAQYVKLGPARSIDDDAAQLRAALRKPDTSNVRHLARALDEKLMRPLRKLVNSKHRLFISPDGMLNLIPFAALVDERDKYLVESYSINYLTSGRDLVRLQLPAASREGPIVIADPLFELSSPSSLSKPATIEGAVERANFKFDRLPGTAQEARTLASLLPNSTVFAEERAMEGALKRLTGPSILHIATHGFFRSNPPQKEMINLAGSTEQRDGEAPARTALKYDPLVQSGLALTGANQLNDWHGDDGILTALEISSLDLWGTKLVVLSACETGLGEVSDGEGVYGLRRALTLAGSQSQIMSLWRIKDEAVRDLMVRYYKLLLGGGGRGEALRRVQLEMIATKDKSIDQSHPYFWAGFIESGDWRSLGDK